MNTRSRNIRIISPCSLILPGILFAILWFAPVVSAQQPTATITALNGNVVASVEGKEVKAELEMVLTEKDTIQTQAGAAATVTLSDGSAIQLGENTTITIEVLFHSPDTAARKSGLKLLYGRIRAFLSFGHQKEGSDFTVETPNAQVGVKFSQPDIEVSYNPETKTTIIIGYTVDVIVTNLVTKEIKRMPKAHQAIVRDEFLWITPFLPGVEEIPPDEQQRQTRSRILLHSRQVVGGTVSTVPISAGARAETSQGPGPGSSPVGPRPRTVTITTSED